MTPGAISQPDRNSAIEFLFKLHILRGMKIKLSLKRKKGQPEIIRRYGWTGVQIIL